MRTMRISQLFLFLGLSRLKMSRVTILGRFVWYAVTLFVTMTDAYGNMIAKSILKLFLRKKETTMSTTHSRETHTPLRLASTAQTLPTSATLSLNEAVAKRRAAGRETIHLGFGEASFPLHPLLAKALAEAAKHTGYAPVLGVPELRRAIAEYLARKRGLTFSSDQIIVAPGSKPLLYALMQVLEGDLLLPVPSWVSYAPQARLAGKRIIAVPTDPHDHHRLIPHMLSEALARAQRDGATPRLLLVNSPNNPTGGMIER